MSQNEETFTLTISFTITKHNKGAIYLSLYNSEDTYMKKSYRGKKVEVKDNKATFSFDGVEKGTYSFSYFHDVNGNKKMDKNFLGIPKEPYGFSNNQKGSFGPPSFEDAKFEFSSDTTLKLSVK